MFVKRPVATVCMSFIAAFCLYVNVAGLQSRATGIALALIFAAAAPFSGFARGRIRLASRYVLCAAAGALVAVVIASALYLPSL